MTRVTINSGACGFLCVVTAEKGPERKISIRLESQCTMVQKLAGEIATVDKMAAAFTDFLNNPVYRAAARHLKHPGCPVPCGIIKAVEVEAGFCLPRDVSISFEK
jgi:hypothetical protein